MVLAVLILSEGFGIDWYDFLLCGPQLKYPAVLQYDPIVIETT